MKRHHFKLIRSLPAVALIGAQLASGSLRAQDTNTAEVIKQLQQRIEELEHKVQALETNQPQAVPTNQDNSAARIESLDQKIKTLEQNEQADAEAAEARAKAGPIITLDGSGFTMASSNQDFRVNLGGVLQVDSRTFFHDSGQVGNDAFLLRRARPILDGTVFRDFDFLFVPDFGGTTVQIFDAWVNYRYSEALQLQAGKMKVPVGLEQLQQDRDILFNERSMVTDLVPNRDVGFELHGKLFSDRIEYAAGIFTGVGDARLSSNTAFQDDKSFSGRLFLNPFKTVDAPALTGFGVGMAGGYESTQATNTTGLPNTTGGTLPGFTTDGQQQFFAYNPTNKSTVVAAGNHYRLSPQGQYLYGPLGIFGEYVISDQDVSRTGAGKQPSADLRNWAWEVTGSWVLTGENASFVGGIVPRHPFAPASGNWGALQLVARYSQLNVDPGAFPMFSDPATSARTATEWAAGLNWYLNRNIRIDASYSHTWFNGGGANTTTTAAPGIVTRRPEDVLFTRLQLAF